MKYIIIFFILITVSFSSNEIIKNKANVFDFGHFDSVNEIKKHPKEDLFISIGKDEQIISWNFNKNSINFIFEFNSGELNNLEVSPNGNFILVSNNQGVVFLINYNTFKLIDAFNYFNSNVINLHFIDNHQVLITYRNKKILLFDIFKKERVRELTVENEILSSEIYNEDLFIAQRDGKITQIRLSDFKILNTFNFHNNNRITAFNLIDSENILIGYEDMTLKLISLKSQKTSFSFSYTSFITDIYSKNNFTVVGFSNGEILLFSDYLNSLYGTMVSHKKNINDIIIDNNRIISASNDSSILIWELPNKKNPDEIQWNSSNKKKINLFPIKKFTSR